MVNSVLANMSNCFELLGPYASLHYDINTNNFEVIEIASIEKEAEYLF